MTDDKTITFDQAMNILNRMSPPDDDDVVELPLELIARLVVDVNRIANAVERAFPPAFN